MCRMLTQHNSWMVSLLAVVHSCLGVVVWHSALSSLLVAITIILYPHFDFSTMKLPFYTHLPSAQCHTIPYTYNANRKADRRHVWIFFFFFFSSSNSSDFCALAAKQRGCHSPAAAAAAAAAGVFSIRLVWTWEAEHMPQWTSGAKNIIFLKCLQL